MKITKAQLRKLTDARSWERGLRYHRNGNVLSLFQDKDTIIGKVSGTHNYNVKLWLKDGRLDGTCSCPMGQAAVFCKHCVAVGLTYLQGEVDSALADPSTRKAKKSQPAITLEDVREYLSRQQTDTLVEIIVDQMMEDDKLRERLIIETARRSRKGPNIAAFEQTINQATDTQGFIDYYSAHDFASRIDNVVDGIEKLLTDGHAQEVIDLTEQALKRMEKALGEMDDSDGYMGGILERLQKIHHIACEKARPEPESLAKRLLEWELATDWDTFYQAAETYADVLGEKGLAVYRSLAQAEWAKIPQLKPGQTERAYHGRRLRLTSIMEALACVDDDVEALVAVKSKDLSSAYRFLDIAQVYKDAGESDKALEWAEKGLEAFAENTDTRLREFLADQYHRRRRHDEAMQLIWLNFTQRPGLENYKILKDHANRTKQWAGWRQRALEYTRAMIADAKKAESANQRYWRSGRDHSMLVEIFIWEQNIEAAWHESQIGGCSDYLWMELAKLREKDYPADAITIYQARVDPIVEQTNNRAYREAILLIKKIRELMKRSGREKEFVQYVSSLKAKYNRKRNFMKMLNRL
jgi:uncharacterized Zn finger protein